MTYGDICKTIRKHRGRVYACVNGEGCQYHILAHKGAMLALFTDQGKTHGMDADSDLEVTVTSGDLYLDTVVPE